ncbi:MAG: protein phosphatase CheZ [Pseudorhodoplanes sp.]|nr:protein phosphatase CheZ [Pseudorhodoplanes sp.]
MAAKRKRFRIEESMRGGSDMFPAMPDSDERFGEIMSEIRALRAMIASIGKSNGGGSSAVDVYEQQIAEARKLQAELSVIDEAIKQTKGDLTTIREQGIDDGQMDRVVQELQAVYSGTSEATDRILKAAEDIEQLSSTLSASLKNEHEKNLAQDIQDQVTQMFEACNFHDLTGQRINKVISTLKLVEDHMSQMVEIWSAIERFTNHVARLSTAPQGDSLLNGPKLDGDEGHSSQNDIDALFH